jgi:hypothetical protein
MERFSQLLDNPQACRIAIQHAESDRRNSEEVHRGNRFPVNAEKGKPAPGWLRISRCPFHPTRNRSLRDTKTEHEKFAMNAWRSPRGVLNNHPENQFPNFLRRLSSPDGPPDSGEQLPVQTESAPVPPHHGFGLRAGVPNVVASRWNVDSEATQLLMNRFYRQLLAGHAVSSACGNADRLPQRRTRPRRIPIETASVRLPAPSLPRIEAT